MSTPTSTAISMPPDRATPAVTHLLLAFIAGFISLLVFQQGVRAALVAADAVSISPYAGSPVVTGVPRLAARAFWGGIWGIIFALIELRMPRRPAYAFWIAALAFGALVPSLFAWFILAPIKGQALAAGGNPVRLGVGLATNALWGLGTAALYRLALYLQSRRVNATETSP